MRSFTAPFVACLALGCSDDALPNGTLKLITGPDDDVFTAEPAAVQIDVNRYSYDKEESERLVRSETMPEGLDLGSAGLFEFEVSGADEEGQRVVGGRTAPWEVSYWAGAELPLLAARLDRFSRAPESFQVPPKSHPLVAMMAVDVIWMVTNSGENAVSDGYSTAFWMQYPPLDAIANLPCPTSPCDASILAVARGQYGYLIGEGWAYGIAFSTSEDVEYVDYVDLEPPEPLEDWAELHGGTSIPTPGATSFAVGFTREEPTDAYAFFDSTGEYYGGQLSTARALAAVTWSPELGLVVVGGSEEGAGVELIPADDATKPSTLDFPPDPVLGAALLADSETTVLRLGGRLPDGTPAPTVRLDLTCEANCVPEELPELSVDFVTGKGFSDGTARLVAAEDLDGKTLVFRVTEDAVTAIPLRVERHHASPLVLPTGHLALVGGVEPGTTRSINELEVVAF